MKPKSYEPKGSLLLRSDHMAKYGRATLVSNWHQAREAEPKDNDVFNNNFEEYDAKTRNVQQSTYKRILNITDGKLPISNCHDSMNQIKLKKDFEEKTSRHPMIDLVTFTETTKPRNTGLPERGFGSALPRHPANHNKRYFNTTYGIDYKDIYSCDDEPSTSNEKDDDIMKKSQAYRKCVSQFTDIAGHRREGSNTWLDESGKYANSEIKKEVFKKTDPIPDRL